MGKILNLNSKQKNFKFKKCECVLFFNHHHCRSAIFFTSVSKSMIVTSAVPVGEFFCLNLHFYLFFNKY